MDDVGQLRQFLRSIGDMSYYEILAVARDADSEAIQSAFHAFSRRYHPDRHVDSTPEALALAGDIFKRAVEAYRCLSRPLHRDRYDRGLKRGRKRLDLERPSSVPPPREIRTLETLARTEDGAHYAKKADHYLDSGALEKARAALAQACKCEPFNHELSERLHLLHEMLDLSGH
jgi:curved DNA-binding protein CbpA